MESVPILMQLDAGISLPVGPLRLSLRSIALMMACSPLIVPVLSTPLPTTVQVLTLVSLFGLAFIASVPTVEGVWFGTLAAYRLADRRLPRLVDRGQVRRARFRRLPDVGVVVDRQRRPRRTPSPFHHWASMARLAGVDDSLFERRPGGWCVVFELLGSEHPPLTPGHAAWAGSAVSWARAVGCAAQFVCTSDHLDGPAAARAFDVGHRPQETLLDNLERRWATTMAEASLRIENHVVFFPRLAGRNGIPTVCSPLHLGETAEASWSDAVRLRDLALRQAGNLRLRVRTLPPEEVRTLFEGTLLGARSASLEDGLLEIGSESHAFLAALRLPPATFAGSSVSALARAQVRGGLSLHLCPVDSAEARKELRRQIAVYRELTRRSQDAEAEAMLAHAEELESRLMARTATVFRAALGGFVRGADRQASLEALEKLQAALEEERFQTERVTTPAIHVAQAALLGGAPLRRNLLLIEESVAGCLLPAAGTPFSDPTQPVLGVNAMVGSTVYHDTFGQQNHNALIAGQSGAGKSVACKTMLVRHALQGAKVVVIDPDNEYRHVVEVLGGDYFELGEDSLNAFDIPLSVPAKEAAENIMGILSVMGGEEQDYVNFKAVRGLGGADKAWLEAEVVQFFEDFRAHLDRVPILSDFVHYLELISMERVREFPRRAERCSEMVLRLKRFTQGRRARVFDRPSSFDLGAPATGIGLYSLANQMGADLAPALAFVLTALLAELESRYLRSGNAAGGGVTKFVILVDEAHWVLQDPEAGKVLERLLRQARKRGAGVWMASQSVHDFVSHPGAASPGQPSLGEILATSASTKLILGIQDAVAEGARTTFELSEAELQAITSRRVQGQGVLITDSERAVVQIMPGPVLAELVFTKPPIADALDGQAEPALPVAGNGLAGLPRRSPPALETGDGGTAP
jgi:TraG P-loop domain